MDHNSALVGSGTLELLTELSIQFQVHLELNHYSTAKKYKYIFSTLWWPTDKSYWAIFKIDFILHHSYRHFCHLLLQKKKRINTKLDSSCPFLQIKKLLGAVQIDFQQEIVHLQWGQSKYRTKLVKKQKRGSPMITQTMS